MRGDHFFVKSGPPASPPETGWNMMRNFSLSTIRPMLEKGTMRKLAALRRVD